MSYKLFISNRNIRYFISMETFCFEITSKIQIYFEFIFYLFILKSILFLRLCTLLFTV